MKYEDVIDALSAFPSMPTVIRANSPLPVRVFARGSEHQVHPANIRVGLSDDGAARELRRHIIDGLGGSNELIGIGNSTMLQYASAETLLIRSDLGEYGHGGRSIHGDWSSLIFVVWEHPECSECGRFEHEVRAAETVTIGFAMPVYFYMEPE